MFFSNAFVFQSVVWGPPTSESWGLVRNASFQSPPQLSLNFESEPAFCQGNPGEGPFFTVSPLEDISVVTEMEKQK